MLQQARTCTRLGLYPWQVRDTGLCAGARVVLHALDHERVVAHRGMVIASAQRFPHKQGQAELLRTG